MEKDFSAKCLIVKYLYEKLQNEDLKDDEKKSYVDTLSVLSQIWKIDLENIPEWVHGELIDLVPDEPEGEVKVNYLLQETNKEFGRGYFDKAFQLISEAISIDDKRADLFSKRAEILIKESHFTEAINDLLICIKINPDDPQAYTKLGFCLWALGKTSEARKVYSDGIEKFPDDAVLKQSLYFLGPETQSRISDIYSLIESKRNTPELQNLLKNEEIASMIKEIEEDSQAAIRYSQSPSFMRLMNVLVDK